MLTLEQFSKKLVYDLTGVFPRVEVGTGNTLVVGSAATHACLSMDNLYREYKVKGLYEEFLKSTVAIINEVISQHTYKINYSAVYPFIKKNDFGTGENVSFYRKSLWCDLDIMWVEDFGSTFRFVQTHEVTDEERLYVESYSNLSKITNKLKRLDETIDIYAFYFTNDFCSSLILDPKVEAEIIKKVSSDILICIPNNSTVLISRYTRNPAILDILENLMMLDTDPNLVSQNIYARVDGEYSIVGRKTKQCSIKRIK